MTEGPIDTIDTAPPEATAPGVQVGDAARPRTESGTAGPDGRHSLSRRDLVLVLAAAAALQAIAWVAIYQILVANGWGYIPSPTSDVSYYANIAYSVVHGMVPYRDFPFEYPPLSLIAFLLSPVSGTLEHYMHWFTAEMIAVDVVVAVLTTLVALRIWRGVGRPLAAAAAFAACVVAAGAIATNRFDPVVAFILVLALLCLAYRRFTLAGAVLGLGFAFKLTPAVVVPLVLVMAGTRRKALWAALAALVAGLLPFVPFLAADAGGVMHSYLGSQLTRGLQVESVAASPYLIAQVVHRGAITVRLPAGGSLVVVGSGTSLVGSLAPFVVVLLLAVVYVAVWRSRTQLRASLETVPVVLLALMLASMLGNKVLSPQHLLWVLPFVALLLVGRPALHKVIGALMVGALVLTQVEFPGMYVRQIEMDPVPFVIIAARNAVLVAAFVLAVVRIWRLRRESLPALDPDEAACAAAPTGERPSADSDGTGGDGAPPAAGVDGALQAFDPTAVSRSWGVRPSRTALWATAAFVAGRAVTFVAGLAAWSGKAQPPSSGRWSGVDPSLLVGGPLGRLFDPWIAWDGSWYATIARHGYQDPQSVAFLPAYSYLLRAASAVTGSVAVAGVLISLVCSAIAMVIVYRMTAARFGEQTAAWTVAFFSLCPASLYFGAVYSESLLLVLVVGSLALAERRMWVGACVTGALAALTRNIGVLVCLPLLLVYAEQRGWSWKRVHLTWPDDARLAWLAVVPAGLALYMAKLWSRFGDPFAFLTVQDAWGRQLTLPPVTVWRAVGQFGHAVNSTVQHWPVTRAWMGPGGDGQWMYAMVLLPFVAFVAAVTVLVAAWRRLPASYNVWALVVVLVPLFSPASNQALLSYPRFLLVGFPLFMGAALLTARMPLVRWTLLGASVLLLAWLSASFALFSWVS